MSGDSVFSTASSVTSNRWPEADSPHTRTRRSSRPSSRVSVAGSVFSERKGGSAGRGGGAVLFGAALWAARACGKAKTATNARLNRTRLFIRLQLLRQCTRAVFDGAKAGNSFLLSNLFQVIRMLR